MLYNTFATIFPVFGLVVTGLLLKQTGFLPETFFKQCNRYAFWIALPCLLFSKIAGATLEFEDSARILTVLLSATTAIILMSWITARLLGLKPTSAAALIHSSFRGNLAYIALPVILYSLESDNVPNLPEAEALAVLCLAPMVPFYNIVAILFLQSAGSKKRMNPITLILESLKNPLVIACVLGFVFSSLSIHTPAPIERGISLIGGTALPLSLLAIGASLSISAIRASSIPVTAAATLKILAAPAVGLLIAHFVHLDPIHARIAIVYLAAPTAVAAFVMTEQMNCDADITASAIVLTTILSIFSLSAAIILT